MRDANHDGPGRLVGNPAGAPHLVGFGPLLGDALAARHLVLLLAGFTVIHRHLAGDRVALANALVRGDRALFPRGARNPHADSLGRRSAAGIAA
jgi:hypothetical protein